MNSPGRKIDKWVRATFLSENLSDESGEVAELRDAACDVEEDLIEQWKKTAFLDDELMEQRIAAEGLDRSTFAKMLENRPSWTWDPEKRTEDSTWDEPSSDAPRWQKTLWSVIQNWDGSDPTGEDNRSAEEYQPFERTVFPFINYAWNKIERSSLSTNGLSYNWTCLRFSLLANLSSILLMSCRGVLILELNVARLEGELEGSTPSQRFEFFQEQLRYRPELWRRIFEEYQVMARLMAIAIDRWIVVVTELLERLSADWPSIHSIFFNDIDEAVLTRADGGMGDLHRGGRTVWTLAFITKGNEPDRAEELHLLYKPKSMSVDRHFQELLIWCNDGIDNGYLSLKDLEHAHLSNCSWPFPRFKVTGVLDRVGYGWQEYIDTLPCFSRAEVARFYIRQGAYLALLHVLESTDFHRENLIAHGEHPVLVDLETLFQHRFEDELGDGAFVKANRMLDDSVMRIGLLPQWILGKYGNPGINLSGLDNAAPQKTPYRVMNLAEMGTDELKIVNTEVEIPPSQNLPMINKEPAKASDYIEELVAGFEAMSRFLSSQREHLLSVDSPLRSFYDDEIRCVLRATRIYFNIINEGTHPDNLRDGYDRDRLLDVLWSYNRQTPYARKATLAEREDLRFGDIPFFSTRPNSHHLWDSRGRRIDDFFPSDSYNRVLENVKSLSLSNLAWQVHLMRLSLATLIQHHEQAIEYSSQNYLSPLITSHPDMGEKITSVDNCFRDALLAEAERMGEQLSKSAIRGDDDLSWIGIIAVDSSRHSLAPCGPNLYDGTSGISLFLAYLGLITGEERYTDLAHISANGIIKEMKGKKTLLESGGGFSGFFSQLYALTHLAHLWDEPSLYKKHVDVLENTLQGDPEKWIVHDEVYDVIDGSAGCIGAILSHFSSTRSEKCLELAVTYAKRLLEGALKTTGGRAWPTAISDSPLTGFAHGTAGIVWSLLSLTRFIKKHPSLSGYAPRFKKLACDAIAYERSTFSKEQRNWPDLRDVTIFGLEKREGVHCMTAWCHGAPGIGLGRVLTLDVLDDPDVRREIEVAVSTTISQVGENGSHCLCHGSLGNVAIVQYAARVLERDDWMKWAHEKSLKIVEEIRARGPICGVPSGASAPGLMTGLAGIGYAMLYIAQPDKVPMLMGLQGPIHANNL